ncbi:MAG: serine/threonine-protein kinase, partial [Planctomycetota bacterium]
MDHPHIARFIDSGATTEGHPYFAMELVDGQSITKYCNQNTLTVRDRVRLMITVCEATQHAHQKGIIHRDLKPSNVMIGENDGKPQPKIIDFGVAKATEESLIQSLVQTRQFEAIGTPLYMSPEQASLSRDVDTRSDVYSLGVILYELLTGSSVIDEETAKSKNTDEIRRIIREELPLRPSRKVALSSDTDKLSAAFATSPRRLSKILNSDLDWIVMKALEKDRARRYVSVADLARDLERWLTGSPVEARAPTLSYFAYRFLQRNAIASVAAAIVLVSLFATTLFSLRQARVARAAESVARDNESSYRAAVSFQSRFLQLYSPNELGANASPLDIIEKGITLIDEELPNEPLAQAIIYAASGDLLFDLGDRKRSVELLESSLKLFNAFGKDTELEAITAKSTLARAYERIQKPNAAFDLAKEVTNANLAESKAFAHAKIQAYFVLARIARQNVRDSAAGHYQKALELALKHDLHKSAATALTQLHGVLMQSQPDNAMAYARQAYEIVMTNFPNDEYKIARAHQCWARAKLYNGNHEEVIELLDPHMETLSDKLGAKHHEVVRAITFLGVAHAELKNKGEALARLNEAWKIADPIAKRFPIVRLGGAPLPHLIET